MTTPQLSPPRTEHSRLFGGVSFLVMPSPPPHRPASSENRRSSMVQGADGKPQMHTSMNRRMSGGLVGSSYEVDKSPARPSIPATFRSAMESLRNEYPAARKNSFDETERLSIENSRYVLLSQQQQQQQQQQQDQQQQKAVEEREEEGEEENMSGEDCKENENDGSDARMRIRSSDFSGDDIRRWLGGNNNAANILPTRILNRQTITSHRQERAKKREAASIRRPQHDAANDIVNSDEKFRFLRRLLAGGATASPASSTSSANSSSAHNTSSGRATTNAAIRQQLLLSATTRNSSESRLNASILEKATNADSSDVPQPKWRQPRRASWLGSSFTASLEAESESSSSDVFGTRSLRNMLLSLKTEELVASNRSIASIRSATSNQSASTQTQTRGGDTDSPTFAASA